MKKVALVISSNGFQEKEYFDTKNVLEKDGINVVTVSDTGGLAISHIGNSQKIDKTINDINISDYDGIFLIGGPGAMMHLDNEKVYKILKEAKSQHLAYGAICISPRILAKASVLGGKKATGWNGDGKVKDDFLLADKSINYVDGPVCVDKNVITADGPMAAELFGKAIVKVLENKN